ncbi:MAG: cardiolipin synthase B [Bryobacteraceae bacterium]|nr:cardiolipin synthase B [Bryobacteraceae bacterium]
MNPTSSEPPEKQAPEPGEDSHQQETNNLALIERKLRRSRVFLVLSLIALAFSGGLLFLALFEPPLPYFVPTDRLESLTSENFIRTLTAVSGGSLFQQTRLEALTNGAVYYEAELEAIRNAQRSVTLEAYIFRPDKVGEQFISALAERARAGVQVRVVVDAIGSFRLTAGSVRELTDAGGRVAWYHPLRWYTWPRLNNRTHRELVVVDGRIGFIGGSGFADWWLYPENGTPPWRDMMLRVEGAAVTGLQGAFAQNWLEATGEILTGEEYFPFPSVAGDSYSLVLASAPTTGRSAPARIAFQKLIAASRERVFITTPYFMPDDSLRDELARAVQRGVDVKIIAPGSHNDHLTTRRSSQRLYGELLQAGAKIYEYQPTMNHTKTMVVDGLWSVVGSTNLDPRSFGLNDEVNLATLDPGVASHLEEDFRADLERSLEITYEEWRRRPFWKKVHEWLGAIIERQQ